MWAYLGWFALFAVVFTLGYAWGYEHGTDDSRFR